MPEHEMPEACKMVPFLKLVSLSEHRENIKTKIIFSVFSLVTKMPVERHRATNASPRTLFRAELRTAVLEDFKA